MSITIYMHRLSINDCITLSARACTNVIVVAVGMSHSEALQLLLRRLGSMMLFLLFSFAFFASLFRLLLFGSEHFLLFVDGGLFDLLDLDRLGLLLLGDLLLSALGERRIDIFRHTYEL